MPRAKRAQRPTLGQALKAVVQRLASLLSMGGVRRNAKRRTLQEWQTQRQNIVAEVKTHLANEESVQAIKKLTRALLEDPQHPRYHELLKKAAAQRRLRRIKNGGKDTWGELPRALRKEALQLEAFSAYVDEVEQLFDKAGIARLSAPAPRDGRQSRAKPQQGANQQSGPSPQVRSRSQSQARSRTSTPGRQKRTRTRSGASG